MINIRNFIFDFDGTLVDTAPLIIRTMQAAIKELNLPARNDDECRATIGLRLEEIPSVLWPEIYGLSATYAATYRRIFDELKRPSNVECFPEVIDTLRLLHENSYRMAIASSRSHKSLSEYVALFGLSNCFSMLIGGNDVVKGKPSPDPVLKILDTQKWQASETLTVGDAPVDILMGKAAGTQTCAVTYGNGSCDDLTATRPDFIISSFGRLLTLLH